MAREYVHDVFEDIAELYDDGDERISLGLHREWKRHVDLAVLPATMCSEPGIVLDVCCGTGDVTEHIARNNPGVLVVGIDFSEHMLAVCRKRTEDLENVLLVEGDAMHLPFDDATFDASCISFGLRNVADYAQVLREMKRVTRPCGAVACLDASVPDNPFVVPFYQVYYKYVMTLLGGGVKYRRQYDWLYKSTQEFLRKDELAALFAEVGLRYVDVHPFMMGAAALHTGHVPPAAGPEESPCGRCAAGSR